MQDVGTLGDGALVVAFLVGVVKMGCGWKNSLRLVMMLLTGAPWFEEGSAGLGFFLSSWIGFSTATMSLSSLDVSGIGNLVGGNVTVSNGIVNFVAGMKSLHDCLQWFIVGPTQHPLVDLSDHVVFYLSLGFVSNALGA